MFSENIIICTTYHNNHYKMSKFNINKTEFSKWYENILIDGDVIDKRYPVKGMPVFRPYGLLLHNRIMGLIEREWENLDFDKVHFPVLIPRQFFEIEKEHFKGFDNELFWINNSTNKEELLEYCDDENFKVDVLKQKLGDMKNNYALRPTSETSIYYMFNKWIRSYNDLPLKVHQSCCVYRYETKNTLPLIRAREILWNEAHTCHASELDALNMLENAWIAYNKVLNQIGVYGLRIRRPSWDTFPGAVHTDVCDTVMPSGKILQIVGAHYLGQKFSVPFDVSYVDDTNTKQYTYITCFGVSTRLLASCISAHGDSSGLVLPSCLAKHQIVVVPIYKAENREIIMKYCKKLCDVLSEKSGASYKVPYKVPYKVSYSVLLDDSTDTPGSKYNKYELMGIPMRVEIGVKEIVSNTVTIKMRVGKGRITFNNDDNLNMNLDKAFQQYNKILCQNSKTWQNKMVTNCSSVDEICKVIDDKGGFAKIPFYTTGEEGKEQDEQIKELCHAEIRGFDVLTKPRNKVCAFTGKPAVVYAYVAKSY
jgi:prolyl-tRNA synthetase